MLIHPDTSCFDPDSIICTLLPHLLPNSHFQNVRSSNEISFASFLPWNMINGSFLYTNISTVSSQLPSVSAFTHHAVFHIDLSCSSGKRDNIQYLEIIHSLSFGLNASTFISFSHVSIHIHIVGNFLNDNNRSLSIFLMLFLFVRKARLL
jgi:hypothetical protein